MNEIKTVIDEFVEAICDLSKVNRLTGIWDNRRFQECKKEFEETDSAYIYKTEKNGRRSVEARAKARLKIDDAYEKIIVLRGKKFAGGNFNINHKISGKSNA